MEAIEVPSKQGRHSVYIYRTKNGDGIEWAFQKRRADGGGFYECCACKKLRTFPEYRGRRTPRAQIVNGKFITDPLNPSNPHFCRFNGIGGALGRRELYKLTQKVRSSRSFHGSYRVEYNAALIGVQNEAAATYDLDRTQKEEMQAVMVGNGGFKSKVSAMRKAGQAARKREAKARSVEEIGGRTLNGDRFLQRSDAAGSFYVFCNSSLISKAFESDCYTVGDDSCYQFGCQEHGRTGQLYSLLLISNSRAYPIVHMVSRFSSEKAFTLMFRIFRDLIEVEGKIRLLPRLKFMFQFEKPYISACRKVFPECTIRSCSCDVTEALNHEWNLLMRGIQVPEDVEEWLTQLRALIHLPAVLAKDYFTEVLQFPPVVVAGDPLVREACFDFVEYIDKTWMQHPQFSDIWDHWLEFNETRNSLCERRHSELNMYLGGVKPSLLELIEALVEEENLTRQSLDESLMEQYDPLRGCHQQKKEEKENTTNEKTRNDVSKKSLSLKQKRKLKGLVLDLRDDVRVQNVSARPAEVHS
uniref:MULE transposase domain-containing protein n=1 Tax=Parascaris univalens TaxID=6257 RepID=A0A914ZU23_PARUN